MKLTPRGTVMVVPSAPAGGLGDDGLVRGCLAGLSQLGLRACAVELGRPWYAEDGIRSTASGLGDGLRVASALNRVRTYSLERWSGAIYVIGADVLDGTYGVEAMLARLQYLKRLAQRGARLNFVGFSWEAHNKEIVEALQGLPSVRFAARDGESQCRFESQTGLRADLGADLAFLVDSMQAPAEPDRAVIAEWRARGMAVVGLTPNGLWRHRYPSMETDLVRLLDHPGMADVGVVLVPHDRRSGQDDGAFAAEIQARVTNGATGRVLLSRIDSFPASRGILSLVDLHIAGRMHSGISSLSVGTPAIMLAFQKKAQGILADAGMEHSALDPRHLPETESVVRLIRCAIRDAPMRRQVLKERLPSIRNRALSGLSGDIG